LADRSLLPQLPTAHCSGKDESSQ